MPSHLHRFALSSSSMAAAMERSRAATEHKSRSLFDLPLDFFDSCRLLSSLSSSSSSIPSSSSSSSTLHLESASEGERKPTTATAAEKEGKEVSSDVESVPRWTCNTCKSEFDSLQDQRSHFKSDVHRLNVKLSTAGKKTIKEEDFDTVDSDSLFEDVDVSSISGSEDEFEKGSILTSGTSGKGREESKQKLYLHLHSGETISIYRSLIMDESEDFSLENGKSGHVGDGGCFSHAEEAELINRLKLLACEPRDKKHLRIIFLASGGHFAGCVFDGNSVVAHKTFHRYVVRAKAGKKQSSKDATGKSANSAGSSLRRHNEVALKKEIQELLVSWRPYIESASSIFVYAPAKNRQMLSDIEKPEFGLHSGAVRYIPLTVRRPTLKEAKRVYYHLTHVAYEGDAKSGLEEVLPSCASDEGNNNQQPIENQLGETSLINESLSQPSTVVECLSSKVENIGLAPCENETTALHDAAKSGDAQLTLELLEQGLNPCIKDGRGRTPYMLATEKEVRNTFRRYMASNLDKWDWHAANVPSPLTKEMEESQAAKQTEKDAKRKAKAKELKKLRKAKEKAKAEAAQAQNVSSVAPQVQGSASGGRGLGSLPVLTAKQGPHYHRGVIISKEEEQRRILAEEREKRAAAAERRIAALNARPTTTTGVAPSSSEPKGCASDVICSCCNASLAGKIPFHRYNYKYCSTTCMHVHREMLEDG